MKSIVSIEKIRELLPQKAPFQMVSHLFKYEETGITTGLTIDENNIFVEDDFFNESGMIENIAQSIALHIGYRYFLLDIEAPVGYIGSVSRVVLHDRPKINDFITTEIEVIKEFMGITLIEGKILCDDKVIMTAQMKTFLSQDPPL
jgi:3-hydroxymyristoyl/3-hydroxydecanoyl-(acyl carrier protein) dehydratase